MCQNILQPRLHDSSTHWLLGNFKTLHGQKLCWFCSWGALSQDPSPSHKKVVCFHAFLGFHLFSYVELRLQHLVVRDIWEPFLHSFPGLLPWLLVSRPNPEAKGETLGTRFGTLLSGIYRSPSHNLCFLWRNITFWRYLFFALASKLSE